MDNLRFINIEKSIGKDKITVRPKPTDNSPKRISSFIADGPKREAVSWPYPMAEYDEVVEKARKGLSGPLNEEMMIAIPNFNEQLLEIIPVNLSDTLTGVDSHPPSDFEKSKFLRQWRVITDPMHVLDLLDYGQLSPLEVETLAAFYPDLYQDMVAATLNTITQQGDTKAPRHVQDLSTLLMVPRVTPDILKPQEEVDEDTGGTPDITVPAEQAETEVQKVQGE